jgi:hypothetical protein
VSRWQRFRSGSDWASARAITTQRWSTPPEKVRFNRALRNEEQAIDLLLDAAGDDAALVSDQPASVGTSLPVARRRAIPVAYVPGLVMRRGSADPNRKTHARASTSATSAHPINIGRPLRRPREPSRRTDNNDGRALARSRTHDACQADTHEEQRHHPRR